MTPLKYSQSSDLTERCMNIFEQKDSNAVKEALDQLSEGGWAKKWGSQPYVSRRTVSVHYQL